MEHLFIIKKFIRRTQYAVHGSNALHTVEILNQINYLRE